MLTDEEAALLTARICAMVLLPGITFILGMSTLWLAKILNWDQKTVAGLQGVRAQFIFSKLLCFAGGVLLATVFMHLMPDLERLVNILIARGELPDLGVKLPWAPFFVMCGFFMVYLIEEMTHAFVHWQSKAKHPRPTQPHALTQCIEEIQQNITGNVVAIDEKPDDEFDLPVKSNEHSHGHSHSVHGHSHAPANTGDDTVLSNIRNVLTIMALSFHCIFEGIAVGIQDTAGEVWTLFGAISSHKFVIAFCVGVELFISETKTHLHYIYVLIFGFVSFLGIAIGWALAGGGDSTQITVTTVVMQGMASGTIVYVTFFEILQREKNTKDNGFAQLAAIMIGFIAMIGLMSLVTTPIITPPNFEMAAANNF